MPVLAINELSKTFRRGFWGRPVHALQRLSLAVEEGEIYGFLGPNGAGKTTTVKLLLRIIYPTAGTAEILGRPLGHPDVVDQVGYMPENPYFYRFLTGREFLGFFGAMLPARPRDVRGRIDALLQQVGMAHAADVRLGEYSKGMVTRIGLAQALLSEPKVLFLDEPMSGLDPIGRHEIRNIIMDLRGQGKTIFFCSHILADVEAICDRVGILNKGELIAEGGLDEILGRDEAFEITVRKQDTAAAPPDYTAPVQDIQDAGASYTLIVPGEVQVPVALEQVRRHGDALLSVTQRRESLENYFIRKLGRAS